MAISRSHLLISGCLFMLLVVIIYSVKLLFDKKKTWPFTTTTNISRSICLFLLATIYNLLGPTKLTGVVGTTALCSLLSAEWREASKYTMMNDCIREVGVGINDLLLT